MLSDALEVHVRAVLPAPEGCAIFLGRDEKVFVIHVDPTLGQILALSLSSTPKERPLTHDLMGNIMSGFGISVQRMVINDAVGTTFYARLILRMENELGVKMVEADSRPSDALVLCTHSQKPIHVSTTLWNRLPDATPLMEKLMGQKP